MACSNKLKVRLSKVALQAKYQSRNIISKKTHKMLKTTFKVIPLDIILKTWFPTPLKQSLCVGDRYCLEEK